MFPSCKALSAAMVAISDVEVLLSTSLLSLMPVLCTIHSLEVSTSFAISSLVTTFAGT